MADFSNYGQDIHYKMISDIDLSGESFTNAIIAPYQSSSTFYGTFDGDGHSIENYTINASEAGWSSTAQNTYLGVFGSINGGTVKNLGIENFNIVSDASSASLVGAGALCGIFLSGSVNDCYSTGSISANDGSGLIGGLCGNYAVFSAASMIDCWSSVSVTSGNGSSYLGGLCGGVHDNGIISQCFSTGSIRAGNRGLLNGGLVGGNLGGRISSCYAAGAVSCGRDSTAIGGFCGVNGGAIDNCYASGSVSGGGSMELLSMSFGGFCGNNNDDGSISNCYSTASVSGIEPLFYFGGFCGNDDDGAIYSKCFWDTQASGISVSAGGTGRNTSQMKTQSTFTDAGWDFLGETANGTNETWMMDGYPAFNSLVPFNLWVANQEVPAGLQGDDDAPAADGIPNLMKYACGLPAMQKCNTDDLMTIGDGLGGVFAVDYHKSKSAMDVVLEPMWTSSLTNTWQAAGIIDSLIENGGSWELRRASIPLGDSGFIRLRATRNP